MKYSLLTSSLLPEASVTILILEIYPDLLAGTLPSHAKKKVLIAYLDNGSPVLPTP